MPNSQLLVDPATNRISTGSFHYDGAGNMTSDGAFNYAFDGANRIISVTQPGTISPVATYAHDASGMRVNRNGNLSIYSGGQVIAEYANGATASSPSVEYIYAGGRRVATLVSGALTYHYWDHISVRSSADGNGNVVRTYGSFPFGENWYETGAANKRKFTTYERDSESSLDYALNRFYGNVSGRFYSLDPLPGTPANPQSLNRYTDAFNNPVTFADPDGQYPRDQHEMFTFWIAAVAGRADAQDLATGAGMADNFWNAAGFPDGLFGVGWIFNYNKHFGDPPSQIRNGIDGGFDMHKIEDVTGPHTVGMWNHIKSNVSGYSVDKTWSVFGFRVAGSGLNLDPGDPLYGAMSSLQDYLNKHNDTLVAIDITPENPLDFRGGCHMEGGQPCDLLGDEFTNATYVTTIRQDTWIIVIWMEQGSGWSGSRVADLAHMYQVGMSSLDIQLANMGLPVD